MSGYLVVDVDGTLTHHTATPTGQLIREALGGWFDMVQLHNKLMAFVDDDGFVKPLPVNEVGTVVLQALGAAHPAYAGPVVITGWHHVDEITALDAVSELLVRTVHDHIRRALADGTVDDPFSVAAREAAEQVRQAPTPGITIVTLGESGGDR